MSAPEVIRSDEPRLESQERELWYLWKQAQEVVRTRVFADITAATGLSEQDVGILVRVDEVGGSLRQSRLAASLGWDRSRLSHHITRMEGRGLVRRRKTGTGVEVLMEPEGQAAADRARPIHARAVRENLIEPLGADFETVRRALETLAGGGQGPSTGEASSLPSENNHDD